VKPEWARECGLPDDCLVTTGIHDSNANFLPYLAKGHSDFLLNSTGTWCVLMRGSETLELNDDEIRAKVFFNQDALGRPVRTSLGTLGMDYDTFMGFTETKDTGDLDAARSVIAKRELFVVPGVLPDATAFPGSRARVVNGVQSFPLDELQKQEGKPFSGLGQAYCAAVNLGLALATARLLRWCGIGRGTTVFIEGGFAKNTTYCQALAAFCPGQSLALTTLKEGTSFGAAITAWMAADKRTLEEVGHLFTIETTPVPRADLGDLAPYVDAFHTLVP
jgi:sugar (pentulose or hexulose) kinase